MTVIYNGIGLLMNQFITVSPVQLFRIMNHFYESLKCNYISLTNKKFYISNLINILFIIRKKKRAKLYVYPRDS